MSKRKVSKKQSSAVILGRWLDLDHELGNGQGVHVPTFAEEHGVSERTVRRDIAVFKAIGQDATCGWVRGPGAHVRWTYREGIAPLFYVNAQAEPGDSAR
jgi:hypothetical protein